MGTYFDLRRIALEMYEAGDLEEAEAVYEKIIKRGCAPASTYCHLVRVRFLMNRLEEAKADLERAMYKWKDENYVLARIQYFQVVFAMLEGKDYQWFIQQIRATCESGGATLYWSMGPVLEFLRSRVIEPEWEVAEVSAYRVVRRCGTKHDATT